MIRPLYARSSFYITIELSETAVAQRITPVSNMTLSRAERTS